MMKRLVMYFTVSAEIEQQQQEHQQKQQRMFSLNSRLNSKNYLCNFYRATLC